MRHAGAGPTAHESASLHRPLEPQELDPRHRWKAWGRCGGTSAESAAQSFLRAAVMQTLHLHRFVECSVASLRSHSTWQPKDRAPPVFVATALEHLLQEHLHDF
eukprot:Skav235818  [mRNA]  locus=scaffold1267:400692:402055:+ [translate_table: standard]